MNTSKALSAALDRFNAQLPEDQALELNWGSEGRRGTWFLHAEYGRNLRTGLSFAELSAAVQQEMERHTEWLAST